MDREAASAGAVRVRPADATVFAGGGRGRAWYRLAVARWDHAIAVYAAAGQPDEAANAFAQPDVVLRGHSDYVNAVAFSLAAGWESVVATGSGPWAATAGRPDAGAVRALIPMELFAGCGRARADDGTCRVWRAEPGQAYADADVVFRFDRPVHTVAWHAKDASKVRAHTSSTFAAGVTMHSLISSTVPRGRVHRPPSSWSPTPAAPSACWTCLHGRPC